jgi:serine/threonine protein kinase
MVTEKKKNFLRIFLEMVVGWLPFFDQDTYKMYSGILKDDPIIPPEFSPEFSQFIQKTLQKEPKNRIGYPEILQEPFFAGIDWEKVGKKQIVPLWIPPASEERFKEYYSLCDANIVEVAEKTDFDFARNYLKRNVF